MQGLVVGRVKFDWIYVVKILDKHKSRRQGALCLFLCVCRPPVLS